MVNNFLHDVAFYEAVQEEQALLKKYLPSSINAFFSDATIQESGQQDLLAPVVSIRTQSHLPIAWADAAEGILTRSTGYDHLVDFFQTTKTCAALGYLPCYCARAVAEQAMLMALSLLRKIKKQMHQCARFERHGLTGSEARGKNLLVVGVGNIGKEIVDIGQGLRMSVAGVDICKKITSLPYMDLQQGLAWADVIICAACLTPMTKNLLNYQTLRGVRQGAILINIARGEIAPLSDLARLLAQGTLSGVAADVFDNEKDLAVALRLDPHTAHPAVAVFNTLNDNDNVLFTPHNAFNTREALEEKAQQSVDSLKMFLEKKTFLWNIPREATC